MKGHLPDYKPNTTLPSFHNRDNQKRNKRTSDSSSRKVTKSSDKKIYDDRSRFYRKSGEVVFYLS